MVIINTLDTIATIHCTVWEKFLGKQRLVSRGGGGGKFEGGLLGLNFAGFVPLCRWPLRVFIEETDKIFKFITEILLQFLEF